ncbi:MAG: hypothetical protein ACRBBP_05590, partial [Bdellovibrionales bacterium]
MKLLIYSIALCLITKSVFAQSTDEVCNKHIKFQKAALSQSKPYSSLNFNALRESNLVLIGETHHSHYRKYKIYQNLLDQYFLGRESKSCLFLEAGGPGATELRFKEDGPVLTLNGEEIKTFGTMHLKGSQDTHETHGMSIWWQISYELSKKGVKIFPIDIDGDAGMNKRNEFMANNINFLFKDGPCKYAATINGFAHLAGQGLSHFTYEFNGTTSIATYSDGRTEEVKNYDTVLKQSGYKTLQSFLDESVFEYSSVRLLETSIDSVKKANDSYTSHDLEGFWNLKTVNSNHEATGSDVLLCSENIESNENLVLQGGAI